MLKQSKHRLVHSFEIMAIISFFPIFFRKKAVYEGTKSNPFKCDMLFHYSIKMERFIFRSPAGYQFLAVGKSVLETFRKNLSAQVEKAFLVSSQMNFLNLWGTYFEVAYQLSWTAGVQF